MPRTKIPLATYASDPDDLTNPGGLRVLKNLAIREANVVTPLPCDYVVAANVGETNSEGRRIWPLKNTNKYEVALFRNVSTNEYSLKTLDVSSENTPDVPDATLLGEGVGLFEARDRVFMSGRRSALVFEQDLSGLRMLTMQPPTLVQYQSRTSTNARAVASGKRVAWRATLHRKEGDYEIYSAPSYEMYQENELGVTVDYTLRIGWVNAGSDSDVRVREDDIVKLWRTKAVANGTNTNGTYYLATEKVLAAGDITARYVDIRDTTTDAGLSEELYTNPGQQGAIEANGQVGACLDAAWYAEHAFYAADYRPSFFKSRVPSKFGYLSTAAERTYGIGMRAVIADYGFASTFITSISDMTGVAIGQLVVSPDFPANTRIVSIISTSPGNGEVQVSSAATANDSAVTVVFMDSLVVNGTRIRLGSLALMMADAWAANVAAIFSLSGGVVVDGGIGSSGALYGSDSVDGVELLVESIAPYGQPTQPMTYAASNPQNWSPDLPAFLAAQDAGTDHKPNRHLWSKLNQPEHVPASQELVTGSAEFIRYVSTQDRLFCFCTDGLYTITGREGVWSVDVFDRDIVIPSQHAADEMNGAVYCYAKDRGLLKIDRNGGVLNLTNNAVQALNIEEQVRQVADQNGNYEAHVVCDELHDEVGVFFLPIRTFA